MKRNTFQRTLITEAIHSLNHPSADDVYAYVSKSHPSISKATIYRNLAKLADDGHILRIRMPNGADHFDYQIHKHYHFHCDKCHQLFDIEIPYNEQFNQINPVDGFIINNHSLTFSGICDKCHPSNNKGKKK